MNASISENNNFRTPNPENIFVLSTNESCAAATLSKASSGNTVQNDKSGDSLFKSFVFEQKSSHDKETEKCINFWKTVMDRNLKPIKCSIIDSKKQHRKQLDDKEISAMCREEVEKAVEAIHEKYRNLWSDMVKEVQKKRLNEVKLIGKTKCIACDTLAAHKECLCKPSKTEGKRAVKKLDDWKSVSAPLRRDQIKEDPVKIARQKAAIEKSYDRRYKFVDVPNEKKNLKSYEEWRRPPNCKCCINDCTCEAAKATSSSLDVPLWDSKGASLREVHVKSLDAAYESGIAIIPSELTHNLSSSFAMGSSITPPKVSCSHVTRENVDMSHFAIALTHSNKFSDTLLCEEAEADQLDSSKENLEDQPKQEENPPGTIPLGELQCDSEPSFTESHIRLYLSRGNQSKRSISDKRCSSILKYPQDEDKIDLNYLTELHGLAQKRSTEPSKLVVKKDSLELARTRLSFHDRQDKGIQKAQGSKIKGN